MEIRNLSEYLYPVFLCELSHLKFVASTIVDDNEADVDIYNSELSRLAASGKDTWYTTPWLYAE